MQSNELCKPGTTWRITKEKLQEFDLNMSYEGTLNTSALVA